ncbi:hypothetical protein [Anaeromassilibacillus sp. SJQ-1]|uniref:hypothetical protein n=1 Tax=Anaeromassilibacillus sp. SJQ-1 TaxID=3375419 RepID=UPI003C7D9A26
MVEQFDGTLPPDYESLLKLPGIGPYTAGAIASIAYGIPVPAVDGNVLRVVMRLIAGWDDIADPNVKRDVAQRMARVLPKDCPGDFNQAMMELGATVCVPGGEPKCLVCPLNALCEGYRQGVARELPIKAKKKARRVEERTVFLLVCDGELGIRRRPTTGLLAGMWETSLRGRKTKPGGVDGTVAGMGRAAPGSKAYAGSKTHLLPCGVAYDRLLGGFKGASRRVYLGGTRDVAAGICPAVGFPRVLRGVYEVNIVYAFLFEQRRGVNGPLPLTPLQLLL